jgi:hypothetical protein
VVIILKSNLKFYLLNFMLLFFICSILDNSLSIFTKPTVRSFIQVVPPNDLIYSALTRNAEAAGKTLINGMLSRDGS